MYRVDALVHGFVGGGVYNWNNFPGEARGAFFYNIHTTPAPRRPLSIRSMFRVRRAVQSYHIIIPNQHVASILHCFHLTAPVAQCYVNKDENIVQYML